MITSKRAQQLLERIGRIEKMERGKICQMTGRPHYNHQTWHDGRNVVRYVRADELPELREAIAGYNLLMELTQQYADEIIRLTRKERRNLSRPGKKNQKTGTRRN